MSVAEVFPEMDDADLLGLLLEDIDHGPDDPFPICENASIDDWISRQGILNSLDTEDFLCSLLGEDETGPVQSLSPLGSDSGISDVSNPLCQSPRNSDTDPAPCLSSELTGSTPLEETEADVMITDVIHVDHCYTIQSEKLDTDALLSVRSERPDTDVFIDLDSDDWSPESVVEMCPELPCTLAIEDAAPCNEANEFQFKEIVLTAEEKRLLAKEGVTIPTHMPLTKAEERTLKRVRRKIRNKQSAQESRKKKKVYVDGLENRVAMCTAQNQELHKKVQFLQKQNVSLIEQVRKLQSMMKLSAVKTSTTSTCLMVFVLSFCLIIFPSFNPFGSSGAQKDLYAPTGVLSRSIRSIPVTESEEVSAPQEVINTMLSSSQNHTPDYETVEQPESESAVSSNSSSDFPMPANGDLKSAGSEPDRLREAAATPMKYQGTGSEEKWIDQQSITIIIQKHHSDEM